MFRRSARGNAAPLDAHIRSLLLALSLSFATRVTTTASTVQIRSYSNKTNTDIHGVVVAAQVRVPPTLLPRV